MLIKFMKWFQGYLFVVIRGYSPERFINLCRNYNILIWNLKKSQEGYQFYISLKAFRQLRPIVRKTHTRPIIEKKIGFPFILKKIEGRKAFALGVVFFAGLIYVMSLFIWDISMDGQYEHTEEALLKYLKEIEVYPGIRKKKLNCQQIEESIRKKYKDIGWVSAEIKGTKLHLKIVETNMPLPYEEATTPCHMIASHDGVITSIVTRNGTPIVKKGDKVKKGDILVSGVVDIIGDNEALLKKETVISDADIRLQTQYPYQKTFSMEYIDRVYTNNKSTVYGISIFRKNFFFMNPLNKFKTFEKYDIIMNEKSLRFNESFILPVSFFQKEYVECKEIKASYTKEEAKEKAKEQLNLYMERLKERDVFVIQNKVSIQIDQKNCITKGYLLVEEPATERKQILENEWRITQTDEPSGDNN